MVRAKERDIRKRIGAGKWFRLLEENVSDSASFDNALELKLLEGKTVESAMLALVPPAFHTICFFHPMFRQRWKFVARRRPLGRACSHGVQRWRVGWCEARSQRFAADALYGYT